MDRKIKDNEYICKKLKSISNIIIIVSPAYKYKKNKEPQIGDHLRVYLNGGIIGTIYDGVHPNGKSTLINNDYYRYSNLSQKDFKKEVSTKLLDNEKILKKLASKEYIDFCNKVLEKKWAKKDKQTNLDKEELEELKERNIEAKILSDHMNNESTWNAIDMEVCFPEDYFNKSNFSDKTTKKPRFDIITISDEGLGFIELKVNNENCGNLNSHYEHMCYVRDNPLLFKNGIIDKIDHLLANGLLSEKNYLKYKKQINDKIWFGFLFVGGKKEDSKNKVKQFKGKDLNKIKFMYCSFKDFKKNKLDINNMKTLDDFISE